MPQKSQHLLISDTRSGQIDYPSFLLLEVLGAREDVLEVG